MIHGRPRSPCPTALLVIDLGFAVDHDFGSSSLFPEFQDLCGLILDLVSSFFPAPYNPMGLSGRWERERCRPVSS